MAICPKCHSDVEIQQQFFGGLFTCPKCQAVYFTNFDGVPEGSSTEPSAPDQSNLANQFSQVDQSMTFEPMQNLENIESQGNQENRENEENPGFQAVDQSIEQNFFEDLNENPPQQKDNLNDVVRYGNSDQVSSPISYRLIISGIDLLQNMNELKEAISDSKLQINFSDLKGKIKKGQLILEGLTPAKAAVLAQRIRTLNLSMKWELKIYE
ncbi:MAG: hypothetical protein ACK5V3_12925 [Bdellovibrionales bacterium]